MTFDGNGNRACGLTQIAAGHVSQAVESLGRAVEQRPGFADYRNNLGEAHLYNGDPRRAPCADARLSLVAVCAGSFSSETK